jgi:hypothetical protein
LGLDDVRGGDRQSESNRNAPIIHLPLRAHLACRKSHGLELGGPERTLAQTS